MKPLVSSAARSSAVLPSMSLTNLRAPFASAGGLPSPPAVATALAGGGGGLACPISTGLRKERDTDPTQVPNDKGGNVATSLNLVSSGSGFL
ncbi:hypothetical protein GUJ93_ZPchr0014g47528 [Zizania palustris]|uniref:Uncharacterized protein n=1 Tax=Zizania palustris TaxID=103762 RepID=A0A8J5TL16_ZIZPA|nr:hypothetical protein GUJ93_ZPchr0014g47528 [Zizania palustris]